MDNSETHATLGTKKKKTQCRKLKRRRIYEPQQNLRVNTGAREV